MRLRTLLVVAALLALAACKKEEEPAPPPPAPAKEVVKPRPKARDNSMPAQSGRSDPDCVGPIDLSVPAKVKIGGRDAELNGYKLTFAQAESSPDASLTFGVVASLNEDSGENLVNLRKYIEFFKAEKADGILVDGDSGESVDALVRVLTPLAESGLPTFVIIGNRECRADFNEAILRLQKQFPNVVNLNRVRLVDFGKVALLSLPGYHDARYIHCPMGCQYFTQNVDALKALAGEIKVPTILVTHGPPKGTAPTAVDAATEAGNVGDAALTGLISQAKIPFGVFANIKEAGGRATDLEGVNVIKQDTFVDALYLNPGPADSVAWAMNDGTESVGMAAVLTVKGTQAKYKIYAAKPLTPDEKAQAARLAPPPEPATAEPAKAEPPKGEGAK